MVHEPLIPRTHLVRISSGLRLLTIEPEPRHITNPVWKQIAEILHLVKFGSNYSEETIQGYFTLLTRLVGITLTPDPDTPPSELCCSFPDPADLPPQSPFPILQENDIAIFDYQKLEVHFERKRKRIPLFDGTKSLSPPPGYPNPDQQWNTVLWALDWVHGLLALFLMETERKRYYRLIQTNSIR